MTIYLVEFMYKYGEYNGVLSAHRSRVSAAQECYRRADLECNPDMYTYIVREVELRELLTDDVIEVKQAVEHAAQTINERASLIAEVEQLKTEYVELDDAYQAIIESHGKCIVGPFRDALIPQLLEEIERLGKELTHHERDTADRIAKELEGSIEYMRRNTPEQDVVYWYMKDVIRNIRSKFCTD